jgi:exosortase
MMSTNMIAADAGRSMVRSKGDGPHTALYQQRSKAEICEVVGAVTLALSLAYAPNLRDLCMTWAQDQNYSHGFLVPIISLYIFWRRLAVAEPASAPSTALAPWWGWGFLVAVLVTRAIAYELGLRWVETATIVPAVACLVWTFGGWPLLRTVWPAIAFLVFMLPLPQTINDLVALPLQRGAATGSCFLLQLSHQWAIQEGNVIKLSTPHGMEQLDVAFVCSGLRMLMTLAATVTATMMLIPLPNWKRVVLLVSAVPIALLSNMIRIVATGWCYYLFPSARGKQLAHDWVGYLIPMILALLLVGLELMILSWLVPQAEEPGEDDGKAILPMLTERKK